MSDHVHDWKPVPNEMAVYACDCGQVGRRHILGPFRGQIVPYVKDSKVAKKRTAPIPDVQESRHMTLYPGVGGNFIGCKTTVGTNEEPYCYEPPRREKKL